MKKSSESTSGISKKSKGSLTNFNDPIDPMLAKLTEKIPESDEYIAEIKWDGYRAIAKIRNGKAELYSRNRNRFSAIYKTITDELSKIKDEVIFDGELVVIDKSGKQEFHQIRNYSVSKKGLLVYYVFDLLWLNGLDLTSQSLSHRKNILKEILPESSHIRYSEHITGKSKELFKKVSEAGLEGIVLKKENSKYFKGGRSDDWLKIKVNKTIDAIIIGYTLPNKTKLFGSFILGRFDKDKIVYFGHAIQVPEKEKNSLFEKVKELKTESPPIIDIPREVITRGVQWLKPELICEVKYNQITASGKLRQTTFLRIRDDITLKDLINQSV